ncbi:hypothetical protein [Serratia bockelmannii]|uniref:hypothetical protein n=1 Tax=Serratia bockelmannii TaxID=2703793 RepID=UPI003FA79048
MDNGSVLSWGPTGELKLPDALLARNTISLCSNRYAIAALQNEGSVIAWGVPNCGGNVVIPDDIGRIVSVTSQPGYTYFSALSETGKVALWGSLLLEEPPSHSRQPPGEDSLL